MNYIPILVKVANECDQAGLYSLADDIDQMVNADSVLSSAISYFGTTLDFNEAGYILPDGSLLDLSGKKRGAQGGYRAEDHREVARFINEKTESITDKMDLFMKQTGAIRISIIGRHGLLDLEIKPTAAQISAILRFISKLSSLDLSLPGSHSVIEYDFDLDRGSRAKLINTIKSI